MLVGLIPLQNDELQLLIIRVFATIVLQGFAQINCRQWPGCADHCRLEQKVMLCLVEHCDEHGHRDCHKIPLLKFADMFVYRDFVENWVLSLKKTGCTSFIVGK